MLDYLCLISNNGLKSHMFRSTVIEILGHIVIHIKEQLIK